jgi:hypothetical protein
MKKLARASAREARRAARWWRLALGWLNPFSWLLAR